MSSQSQAFVASLNVNRRHLSESQRAMAAANLANMVVGGDRVSEHSANLQNGAVSQTHAAELLQVSPRSVASAAKVKRTAPAEVVEAVKNGNISLNMAAQVAEAKSPALAENLGSSFGESALSRELEVRRL